MIKKYILFISISALVASVSLARLNPGDDPNMRANGASAPSFTEQFANLVAVAAALNNGGVSSESLTPPSNEVSSDNSHIQLSGNSKPTAPVQEGSDNDGTEI